MAIEYVLYAECSEDANALICSMLVQLDGIVSGLSQNRVGFDANTIRVVVTNVDSVSARFISDDFALLPNIRILYRLDKFRLEDDQNLLVRCVLAALQSTAGNVILLANGELLALERRNGIVRIDPSRGIWRTQAMGVFATAFKFGEPLP